MIGHRVYLNLVINGVHINASLLPRYRFKCNLHSFVAEEKVMSNLSRFVVIIWVFVVLVLTSSYTASLTSMLTVQQLQPTITDLFDLIKNGEYIGYQTGSFVTELLKSKKFDASQFRNYNTFEEYDEALRKGSRNGGVDGIVDELPYIRLFLAKYCRKYTMVGPTFKTAGFGFVSPDTKKVLRLLIIYFLITYGMVDDL